MRALCADRGAPIGNWRTRTPSSASPRLPLDPADTPWFGQLMAGPQMLAYLLQLNDWMAERGVAVELE